MNDTAKSVSAVPRRGLATPLSERGIPKPLVYLGGLLGLVYLINPTFGVFELLPDNLPFVGNLDEGGAMLLLWYGVLEWRDGRRRRNG
jgi:hypothetical protein